MSCEAALGAVGVATEAAGAGVDPTLVQSTCGKRLPHTTGHRHTLGIDGHLSLHSVAR